MIMKQEYNKWVELLNKRVKMWQLPEYDKPRGIKIVGVIPDMHVSSQHPKAIEFLVDTFITRGVTHIVCIGDWFDMGWQSKKYLKNYNMMGPKETRDATQKYLNKFGQEFPVLKYAIGNHDLRLVAKTEDDFAEDFEEALRRTYNIPEGWEFDIQFIIDNVVYLHGTGNSGVNANYNLMKSKRRSVVHGHLHSLPGITYSNNGIDITFGMNVGSLIDMNSLAFEYGVNSKEKPVNGCGIVYNSKHAEFVPMV